RRRHTRFSRDWSSDVCSSDLLLTVFLLVFLAQESKAQYRNALGLGIDLGDGRTLVGPQLKHFFNSKDAANVQVLFADNHVLLGRSEERRVGKECRSRCGQKVY